jgi:hypothetical protein
VAFLPAERIKSMFSTLITFAGTIADLQNRNDLILITDSQEVQAILSDLNYFALEEDRLLDFDGLFVSIQDSAYAAIFAFEGIVPYLWKDVFRIELQ